MSLEATVELIRWILLATSVGVLAYCSLGFFAFAAGDQCYDTYLRSFAFLYALSIFSVQSSYLLEGVQAPSPHWRVLVSVLLQLGVMAHAIFGLYWLRNIGRIKQVLDHLTEASAIADLAKVDPAGAKALAEEARRRTAGRVMRGGTGNGGR